MHTTNQIRTTMNFFKQFSVFILLLSNTLTLTACVNSNSSNIQTNAGIEEKQSTQGEQQTEVTGTNSKIQSELDKAKKAGKAVFVVVTGTGSSDTDKAKGIAKGATSIYKNAIIVVMNRDDAANAKLVAEWRLAGAPLPLILVLSSKGQPAGGLVLAEATPENIAALVPSPKLEDVYTAIGNSKNAIVVFTKKSFADRAEVIKIAKEAVSMLDQEAVFIEVDMEDQKETGFMQQLRINRIMSESSVTVVINKQGQVAGTSTTVPDANKLVAAVKTPVKSGCGPGCGPAGCGK